MPTAMPFADATVPYCQKSQLAMEGRRERAARALCAKAGYAEDTMFDGKPAWEWYLVQVDIVLEAILSPEELAPWQELGKAD